MFHVCSDEINAATVSIPAVGLAIHWLRMKLSARKQPSVVYNGARVTMTTDPRIR